MSRHPARPCRPRAVLPAAGLLLAAACSTADEIFPPTGSLRLTLRDGALGFQSSDSTTSQLARWTVEEASAEVSSEPAPFSFLGGAPCVFTDTPIRALDLTQACRGSGLVLGTEGGRDVTFRVRISHMELRRAGRPDLVPGGDHDGDGVANGPDNCPIVPNPRACSSDSSRTCLEDSDCPRTCSNDPLRECQQDSDCPAPGVCPAPACRQPDLNNDGTGDACSRPDTGLPDQDGDEVPDVLDNCLWVPNPPPNPDEAQPDGDLDGIGDACQEVAPVILPGGRITVDCAVEFTPQASTLGVYAVTFDEGSAVLCDGSYTGCTLDPMGVKAFLAGTDPAAATPCAVGP